MDKTRFALFFATVLSPPAANPCHLSDNGGYEMLAQPAGLGSGGGSARCRLWAGAQEMEVHYISELVKQGCLTVSDVYFAALDELPGPGR